MAAFRNRALAILATAAIDIATSMPASQSGLWSRMRCWKARWARRARRAWAGKHLKSMGRLGPPNSILKGYCRDFESRSKYATAFCTRVTCLSSPGARKVHSEIRTDSSIPPFTAYVYNFDTQDTGPAYTHSRRATNPDTGLRPSSGSDRGRRGEEIGSAAAGRFE